MKSAVLLAQERIEDQDLLPYFRRTVGRPVGGEAGAKQVEFSFMVGMNLGSGERVDLKKIRGQAAAEAERRIITDLLTKSSRKKSEIAKQLGVDRKTLRAKMRKLGISLD
jgi:DNA-binding NtrC family response regulator